jgi:cysteinyl-tRNA synthetase, unknown class
MRIVLVRAILGSAAALSGSAVALEAALARSAAEVSAGAPLATPVPIPTPARRPAVIPPPVPLPPAAAGPPTNPQARSQQRAKVQLEAQAERLARITGAKSWGYQLNSMTMEEAANAPYDLLVVDATTGLASGKPFTRAEVERLKRKPDGSRRIVVSYLSVGEAEDYRPDYFTPEYMTEDAPDWLMHENKDWKGNRLIRFCNKGWQATILGDDDGRSVYNSIDPSPLYRLVELGFDGIYLDRVDVYSEISKECPDGAARMVDFIARLGAHARKRDPHFMVILQNAEELLEHKAMMATIDAIAKESLFHGWGGTQGNNSEAVRLLKSAQSAGRGVFVVDYPSNRAKADISVSRIKALGFVPYIGPKDLNQLWLPGRNF